MNAVKSETMNSWKLFDENWTVAMTTHEHKPLTKKIVLMAVRDIVIAAIIGWAGVEGAIVLLHIYIPQEYVQHEWYADFQTLVEMTAGATMGGMAYAIALHFNAKRDTTEATEVRPQQD